MDREEEAINKLTAIQQKVPKKMFLGQIVREIVVDNCHEPVGIDDAIKELDKFVEEEVSMEDV